MPLSRLLGQAGLQVMLCSWVGSLAGLPAGVRSRLCSTTRQGPMLDSAAGWGYKLGSTAGWYWRLGFKAAQGLFRLPGYAGPTAMFNSCQCYWLCSLARQTVWCAWGCQASMAMLFGGAGLEAMLSIRRDYEFVSRPGGALEQAPLPIWPIGWGSKAGRTDNQARWSDGTTGWVCRWVQLLPGISVWHHCKWVSGQPRSEHWWL